MDSLASKVINLLVRFSFSSLTRNRDGPSTTTQSPTPGLLSDSIEDVLVSLSKASKTGTILLILVRWYEY